MADRRRKNPARKRLVVLLLAACFGGLMVHAQTRAPKREVDITPEPTQTLSAGLYYALVIGNNNYQPPLHKLETAVNDATAVGKLLQERYGFSAPKVLLNATRAEILTELYRYRRTLPENSSLLIYYAGHGTKDRQTKKAYWLPVDAQADNDLNWISASTIIEEISALRSAHVLVISDSCFSGELTRDLDVPREIRDPSQHGAYLRRMLESPSRTLMASGRDEPVADGGSAGHSKFAYVLLESLRRINDNEFTAGYLFQTFIQTWVAGESDQVPQYSVIQNSGHAYGDFVFSRGGKVEAVGSNKGAATGHDDPSKQYIPLAPHSLPEITCKTVSTPGGLGPQIRQGDIVPCNLLDQPLTWLMTYELPKPPPQTKWTAMLTVMVDEDGRVSDLRPRGGTSLQGMESWLKTAAQGWQTNPPTYKGTRVKSSFALDIDFGQ